MDHWRSLGFTAARLVLKEYAQPLTLGLIIRYLSPHQEKLCSDLCLPGQPSIKFPNISYGFILIAPMGHPTIFLATPRGFARACDAEWILNMTPLPKLMVAPNGARRMPSDHPALPITDDALIETAMACRAAGADGIHAHIRDAQGKHEIDAGHYRAVMARLREAVPDMYVQVTSESADRYTGAEQRAIMRDLAPPHVSVALREMVRQKSDWGEAQDFYAWARAAQVEIQHILYSPAEVRSFVEALDTGRIPGDAHLVQLVQGSYAKGSEGQTPLADYLAELNKAEGMHFDWMLCAFGTDETDNLARAAQHGGKARVGFENSFWNKDGSRASDNAMRVREVKAAIETAVQGG